MKQSTVLQSRLTGECWLIQMWGRDACESCEVEGTKECGGENIIKSGKNELGYFVPLGKIKEGIHEEG